MSKTHWPISVISSFPKINGLIQNNVFGIDYITDFASNLLTQSLDWVYAICHQYRKMLGVRVLMIFPHDELIKMRFDENLLEYLALQYSPM